MFCGAAVLKSGAGKWRQALARVMFVACFGTAPIILGFTSADVAAHQPTALEEQVKAAMLFKFLSYIAWPDPPEQVGAAYRVHTLNAGRIAAELGEIVAERNIDGRPVEVLNVNSVDHIQQPHMVFVGRHAERHLPKVAALAEQQGFLVVTENEEGIVPGATINLRLINDRMGFDVSLPSAQAYNLKLSARLLSVAANVEQQSP